MRPMQLARFVRALRWMVRRPGWLLVTGLGLATALTLLLYGTLNTGDGVPNAALNLGTSMLGALITVAVIGPIIRYVQEGTVREHGRLDYLFTPERWAGRLASCEVFDAPDRAREASDHFPLLVEIADG